jgi:hypothetical protein
MRKKLGISSFLHTLIFTALVNLGMAFFISMSIHMLNVGLQHMDLWFHNFVISLTIGFPIALLLVFGIDKLMNKIFIITK